MKPVIPFIVCCFIASFSFAQDVRLNDSVIFVNDKPLALYAKWGSVSPLHPNMEVYSFDDYVLVKAEAIRFNAPVPDLRPFYYYELTFPPTADTLAVYIEGEAFPLLLSRIISTYDLINKNELNKKNLAKFIKNYPGGPALTAKIKSFENHLNDTRYFHEQEIRDRSKPVTIINDRIIMQDGVKIGLIAQIKDFNVSNRAASVATDKTSYGHNIATVTDQVITTSTNIEIVMTNGRKVGGYAPPGNWVPENKKKKAEKNLYQISLEANPKISTYTDQLLMRVCSLIEHYWL